jgi:SAM-dependent methyltransferase
VSKKPARVQREAKPSELRAAIVRRLPRRIVGSGQIELPAVPALLENYVQQLRNTFDQLGRVFSRDEIDRMRVILKDKLDQGFAASPYSRLIVAYETDPPPELTLTYRVDVQVFSVEDEYARWVDTRTPPLFGEHPDAKVMLLARSLGVPSDVPVLDIGAGTGRNTLPLAREGFPTDAVELAPALAAILRELVKAEDLSVRVFEGDAMDESIAIPENHYKLVVLAEVVASHIRTVEQCHDLFEGAADSLTPGGLLVFSAFLPVGGFRPDATTRELSEVFWCTVFTREDMAAAMAGLPFELVSDESVHDYEKANLPEGAWPPTGWFEQWSKGLDLYDLPLGTAPIEARWLVYRKT